MRYSSGIKEKKHQRSVKSCFIPLFHFLFLSLFDFLQWKCSSLINLSSVLRESFPVNSIFVCQFHDSVIVKWCRKKRSIVTIQSGCRVGGWGGMMKEQPLSSSLLVSIPFHFCHHFLRSLVPVHCRLLGSDGLLVNPHFALSLVLAQLC